MPAPTLYIAGHRGLPQDYPENTLIGLEAALAAGAHGVEIDIQFTKDGEPVLLHDLTLKRVTGLSGDVSMFEFSVLGKMSAHEPARFGSRFLPTPIEALRSIVPLMRLYSQATLFVELKAESFAHTHRQQAVTKLATVLAPIANQCVVISYDIAVLRLVRELLDWPIGWVLSQYNDDILAQAKECQPEYLICHVAKLPPAPTALCLGLWQWFIYDITDAEVAKQLAARGVSWVESWDVTALIKDLKI
ncbi:glycerophosphodiester phosphodiesterase family protein [Marinagarivorans algicola]|uniref:glycerophosphodiester phosphodiesterase family protein n=1 Tax=Marinagarivorans algicola TaxID=1513270 RepID=UPI0006B4DEA3|nr:glycerophosphodiester phosphodiesterase family protein [Marinagarivorans algicola]